MTLLLSLPRSSGTFTQEAALITAGRLVGEGGMVVTLMENAMKGLIYRGGCCFCCGSEQNFLLRCSVGG